MSGTAACRRITLPPVRSFLPSKILRGSPKDLDPNEIAVNLVITRMLRNIPAVEITSDSITYSDSKVSQFCFRTYDCFSNDCWTGSNFHAFIKSGDTTTEIRGPNRKIAFAIAKVVAMKEAYTTQKAKEVENAKAFAVIEALTDTGLPIR